MANGNKYPAFTLPQVLDQDSYHWVWRRGDAQPLVIEWRGNYRKDKKDKNSCWVVPDEMEALTGQELVEKGFKYLQQLIKPPFNNPFDEDK